MEPFEITIEDNIYCVYPDYDETNKTSHFAIAVDAVEIGVLENFEAEVWRWKEGGTNFDPYEFGIKIEAKYD